MWSACFPRRRALRLGEQAGPESQAHELAVCPSREKTDFWSKSHRKIVSPGFHL